jgi:hypothetical protein
MKIIVVTLLTASTVLLAQDGPVAVQFNNQTFQFMVSGLTVKNAPYSAQAVSETTQTLGDGTHIARTSTSMLYRDSAGRERREETLGNLGIVNASGQPMQTIFISDPVAGVSYSLDPASHTARKMPAPPPPPADALEQDIRKAKLLQRSGDIGGVVTVGGVGTMSTMSFSTSPAGGVAPPKEENLGTMTIEGVQAQGTRTTMTIPIGQIGNDRPIDVVSERWYSPDLKMTVLSKQIDPRMGETDYRLTQIDRSEPLPSLFEVPSDYKIADAPQTWYTAAPAKPKE